MSPWSPLHSGENENLGYALRTFKDWIENTKKNYRQINKYGAEYDSFLQKTQIKSKKEWV